MQQLHKFYPCGERLVRSHHYRSPTSTFEYLWYPRRCDGTHRAQPEMNALGDVLEPRATPESRLPAHRVGATTRCAASAHRSVLENQAIPRGAEKLRALQTQPSLHIIRSFSTMNLPSLYFWLSSNASSWRGKRAQQRRQ